ncbi:MAG: RecB family exonuclease, partial [Nitrososphaera sp.]
IMTYMECPLRFKLSRIPHVPEPARTYFDVGSAVHAVAEHLTMKQKDGVQPTEELAFELLTKEWNSNAFQSETEENQKKAEAKEMIRNYLHWLATNPNVPMDVEKDFRIEIAGVPYIGKIDRVEQTPNGELEVIDFKTGYARENSKSVREDPQMNVYALAVQKLYGKLPKRASLFYVKHDKLVPYEVSQSQVDKVKEVLAENTTAILQEKFEATPSYQTCRNCAYWDLCDFKETEES